MSIFDTILKIYNEYFLCIHCLGRMFSLLATNTTNLERGKALLLSLTMQLHEKLLLNKEKNPEIVENLKILAENAGYIPAQKVLEKEGFSVKMPVNSNECHLCHGIFLDLNKYLEAVINKVKDIEFDNFLVGTTLDGQIVDNEDTFKSKFNISGSESFKGHFNREIGKRLSQIFKKPTMFQNPDITIIFHLNWDSFNVEVLIKSIFIYGRYNKFIKGIPQTHWLCNKCRGEGCSECDYTGKQYKTSIEELISSEFINQAKASGSKFHGAGREDMDVRMLGNGRPFILELKNPKVRKIDLKQIEKKVNKKLKKKIQIHGLRFSNKKEVISLKERAETTKKTYQAIVQSENKLTKEQFSNLLKILIDELVGKKIRQRTPTRVSHRRADKIREKTIYEIKGKYLKPNLFEFIIQTQGGTYIKELINGDKGRTSPSFSEIFKMPLICKYLDVIEIDYKV
ncbi:MAG: tRNA pseudouridine(54/55) synthase Pus10 [Promethearchaeota archaeon]